MTQRRRIQDNDTTADIHDEASTIDAAQHLQAVSGKNPITASAMVFALTDIADCTSGRDLFAWLGVTTRLHPTGAK